MEVSVLIRIIPVLGLVMIGIAIIASGCSSNKPGLLEQKGIKNANDLIFITINGAEVNGNYLITDKTIISRVYQLLNDAEHGGMSKYFRPNIVTLVRKNGTTLSFAFGLYNPGLAWKYSSCPFVEFVKNEIIGKKKYADKSCLPPF
jgi:hypothetical protein